MIVLLYGEKIMTIC